MIFIVVVVTNVAIASHIASYMLLHILHITLLKMYGYVLWNGYIIMYLCMYVCTYIIYGCNTVDPVNENVITLKPCKFDF